MCGVLFVAMLLITVSLGSMTNRETQTELFLDVDTQPSQLWQNKSGSQEVVITPHEPQK